MEGTKDCLSRPSVGSVSACCVGKRRTNGKEPTCNAGDIRDMGLIRGPGRSPGKGNGYPFQYSCLENSMDRSLVSYSPWGRKESEMIEQLTRKQVCIIGPALTM